MKYKKKLENNTKTKKKTYKTTDVTDKKLWFHNRQNEYNLRMVYI